jgi:hypothetical protein
MREILNRTKARLEGKGIAGAAWQMYYRSGKRYDVRIPAMLFKGPVYLFSVKMDEARNSYPGVTLSKALWKFRGEFLLALREGFFAHPDAGYHLEGGYWLRLGLAILRRAGKYRPVSKRADYRAWLRRVRAKHPEWKWIQKRERSKGKRSR